MDIQEFSFHTIQNTVVHIRIHTDHPRVLDYIQHSQLYSRGNGLYLYTTTLHILPRWDTCRAMADKGGKVKEVGRLSYVVPVIKSVAV